MKIKKKAKKKVSFCVKMVKNRLNGINGENISIKNIGFIMPFLQRI